jgi:hypothetical protein
MSASGNKNTKYRRNLYCRFVTSTVASLLGMSLPNFANADLIFGDIANLDLRFAPLISRDVLKIETNKSAFVLQEAYYQFAQDIAPIPGVGALAFCHASGRLGLTCVAAPVLFSNHTALSRDEKSILYVQAKHFRYYVIPNNRENPSDMERITLSHQASGTQSKMLVMAK